MTEIWKEIEGFENLYQVSNLGNVKRVTPFGHNLANCNNGNGYIRVSLCKDGIVTRHYVHRLVANAFLPSPLLHQIEVNHIDGNPANNAANNLQWTSRLENERHAIAKLGKSNAGEANGQAKLNTATVKEIRLSYERGYTRKELAERFRFISYGTICDIIAYRRWGHI